MSLPDDADLTTHAFHIGSPCGRIFLLPMVSVRDDYADFLMKADHLSYEEALTNITPSAVEDWFFSQFDWDDIDRLGTCIHSPSPQQILDALNTVRREKSPGNSARMQPMPEKIAERRAEALSAQMPDPTETSSPMRIRF